MDATGRYLDATGSAHIRNVITFEGFEDPGWAAPSFWIGRVDYQAEINPMEPNHYVRLFGMSW